MSRYAARGGPNASLYAALFAKNQRIAAYRRRKAQAANTIKRFFKNMKWYKVRRNMWARARANEWFKRAHLED